MTQPLWKYVTTLARNLVVPLYRYSLMAPCLTLKQLVSHQPSIDSLVRQLELKLSQPYQQQQLEEE